jgi:cytochrome c-type biogenesis protein CcmH/NrfG
MTACFPRLFSVLLFGSFLASCSTLSEKFSNDSHALDLISINAAAQLAAEGDETAKAEALYKSLVRRVPNDSETWLRLGNLYAKNNKPDEAVGAYQRALIANGREARAWNNLAVIRLRQAWAALLQVQAMGTPAVSDSLYTQVEEALNHLEKLPYLTGESRTVKGGADATKY